MPEKAPSRAILASVLYARAKSLQDQFPSLITAKEKDQSDDETNFLASDQMTDDASPTQLEVPQPAATHLTAEQMIYLERVVADRSIATQMYANCILLYVCA
ncbi:hypothetical protein VPH35_094955 [Triticum aestivum]